MIRIQALTKRYGERTAVDALSLEVRPGEIFGFLGRNGAGKTTTLKVCVGLLAPTAGSVSIGGHDVAAAPEAAKRVLGYVPDRPYLYEKLTGWEFLSFVAGLRGLDRDGDAWEKKASVLLDAFDLASARHGLVESYSHGMKQKLALTGALLHDPGAILLDEPLVGLDPRSARVLKDLLRERAKAGAAVFFSTHILEIAEKMCDRVAILEQGRLLCVESVADLTRRLQGDLEEVFLKLTNEAAAA